MKWAGNPKVLIITEKSTALVHLRDLVSDSPLNEPALRIVNIAVALRGHSKLARRNRPAKIDGDRPGQRHAAQLTRRYQPCADDLAVVEL
jgi:hypothetical protein